MRVLPDEARSSVVSAPSLLLRCRCRPPGTPDVVPMVGRGPGGVAGGRASPPSDASARSIIRVPELQRTNVSTSAHDSAVLMFAFVEIRLARPGRGSPRHFMAFRFLAPSPQGSSTAKGPNGLRGGRRNFTLRTSAGPTEHEPPICTPSTLQATTPASTRPRSTAQQS